MSEIEMVGQWYSCDFCGETNVGDPSENRQELLCIEEFEMDADASDTVIAAAFRNDADLVERYVLACGCTMSDPEWCAYDQGFGCPTCGYLHVERVEAENCCAPTVDVPVLGYANTESAAELLKSQGWVVLPPAQSA